MDTKEYIKQQGTFLKAEDVTKNPTSLWEISDEGKMVLSEKFGTTRLHLSIKLGDEEFVFDCSKTNARTIANKLGADTKNWIGKFLTLETYKTKTSEGKLVDAINVKDIK